MNLLAINCLWEIPRQRDRMLSSHQRLSHSDISSFAGSIIFFKHKDEGLTLCWNKLEKLIDPLKIQGEELIAGVWRV